jgi:CheY-like chemotaxis protein
MRDRETTNFLQVAVGVSELLGISPTDTPPVLSQTNISGACQNSSIGFWYMSGQFDSLAGVAPKRVLFVDDEPSIRATLPVILRKHGFEVTVAGSVQESLDKIRNQEFDLLLCDLNIDREGDGFKVVRAMRETNPLCVAIIITGYPTLESAIEGIHHALDDYVLKPTNTSTLVAMMGERLMAKAGSK